MLAAMRRASSAYGTICGSASFPTVPPDCSSVDLFCARYVVSRDPQESFGGIRIASGLRKLRERCRLSADGILSLLPRSPQNFQKLPV